MLDIEDHRRDGAGMTYIYPVVSRRAGGLSIGINLNVNNACNWACIYCQVENLQRGKPPPVDLACLRRELDTLLTQVVDGDFLARAFAPEGCPLKDVAFSGNGESTCAPEFAEAVAIARDVLTARRLLPEVRLRLITNGSQLHRAAVRRGIALLGESGGEVWFKIDRASTADTRAINGVTLAPEKRLANLRRCCTLAPTWVQTCWFGLDGASPSPGERHEYCRLLAGVAGEVAGVHLYGLARPSLQNGAARLSRLSLPELENFAGEIQKQTGIRVVVNP